MRCLTGLLLALWPVSLAAQVAQSCDWRARADAIVEPWDAHTKTFSNGEVRVALLDVLEPAAGSVYLLLLHPPRAELGERTCTVIGQSDNFGYAGIMFDELSASYDPATGLTLTVPAIIYLPEASFKNSALVRVMINQATGDVQVTQDLGNE